MSQLWDPESKETCLILQMLSILPEIAKIIYGISKYKDEQQIQNLGPFVRTIHGIMNGWAEKRRNDRFLFGKLDHRPWENIVSPEGFFSQSVLLFRGTYMKQEAIDDWEDMIGCTTPEGRIDFVKLQGYTTTF